MRGGEVGGRGGGGGEVGGAFFIASFVFFTQFRLYRWCPIPVPKCLLQVDMADLVVDEGD